MNNRKQVKRSQCDKGFTQDLSLSELGSVCAGLLIIRDGC